MTLLADRPRLDRRSPHEHQHGPTGILKWLTSTDHKVIGKSYLITSFVFFCMAGLHGDDHADPARLAGQRPSSASTPTTSCSRCTAA